MQCSVRRLFSVMLCSSVLLTTIAAISAECSHTRMEATADFANLYLTSAVVLQILCFHVHFSHLKSLARTCCTALSTAPDKARQECVQKVVKSIRRPNKITAADILAINVCIEECNYVENGYLEAVPPYTLDLNNLADNLRTYIPDATQTTLFLLEAHENCATFLKNHGEHMDIKFPMVDSVDEPCNPYALRLVSCVRIYGMQECPRELYLQTDGCSRAKQYFTNCVARIRANLL